LLFISNYGDGHERKISFAHFSQDPKTNNLPTLKVLAWDDLDTPRHIHLQARARGKWVHCGRVNSLRRYRYCEAIGVQSVDGTFLKWRPAIRFPELLGWIRHAEERPGLFSLQEQEPA
jgi:hypothetical protein